MKNLLLYLLVLLFNSCSAKTPDPTQKQIAHKKLEPKDYPQNYFRNPLGVPIKLSANFGELRPNHFHMGFDIRTNQRENLPVYAAAEGYVSRVSIEESGFGHAIYITHPNGFTTVYGHLNEYFPALENYVRQQQYADESWEQDITFTPEQFPVSKGQFIALSGNTGASAGPHVHFEIRDTETGNNLNPWLFNFNLSDNIPPSIIRLYYYDRRYSTYTTSPKPIAIKNVGGSYSANGVVVLSSPQISFGISATDRSGVSNSGGIYEAQLIIDDSLQNDFVLNDISYTNTRYLNGSIDYKTKYSGGAYIQHLSRLPGNHSTIFSNDVSNGVISINDSGTHNAEIIVKDAAGNASILKLKFKVLSSSPMQVATAANVTSLLPNRENTIQQDGLTVNFSANAFYDTVPFLYKFEEPKDGKTVSRVHYLHNYKVPVHDSFTVQVQPTVTLTNEQKNKVVMQLVSNTKTEVAKGYWINNSLSAKFRDLGIVRLLIDSTPPAILPLGWKSGSRLSANKSIAVAVRDNLGKIKIFNAYLDGKWLLFSKKNGVFTHKFDERTSSGRHDLKIIAEDIAGNTTERTYTFIR